jgi:hypothetical protein
MRVIPRLGYRLTEFAYLAAASKATRAGNLAFPCKPNGYLLGSYRIATTPEPNSNRLTSFKSTRFDNPANNVGPWPASLGCTKNEKSLNERAAKSAANRVPDLGCGRLMVGERKGCSRICRAVWYLGRACWYLMCGKNTLTGAEKVAYGSR